MFVNAHLSKEHVMNSLFPLVLTERLESAATFYRSLFGFEIVAQLEWYVQLHHPENEAIQIAFIAPDHDSVPASHHRSPQGILITVDVADATAVRERAAKAGHPIVVELQDEPWGQRHFMTEDPTGLLVDVVEQLGTPLDALEG
jgi:uncharacterized glyoxalase superfamily protein PhnB